MRDPQDIVEIGGKTLTSGVKPVKSPAESASTKFLSIWFRCCHTYGRLRRNAEQTEYEGRCPRCGARVAARIGVGGSSRRMFEAR